MPDLEGALPLILLMIFLWVRSIGAAMKKNRQRQEQALEQAAADADPGFEAESARVRAAEPAEGEGRPAPRRTLRGQLREMGRQFEEQMRQAAEEGRPGSLVGHVEPEETPETPPFLRPASSVPARSPSPAPAAAAPPAPRRTRERRTPPSAPVVGGPSRRAASGRGGSSPLGRFDDRYSPLARAVILSEILGTPPGLTDREGPPASRE